MAAGLGSAFLGGLGGGAGSAAVGAVLGGIGGGKKSGGSSAPKWLRRDTRAFAEFGKKQAQTPYEQYTGERVAGFSPDTLAAFDMIRNNVGATSPAYQQAIAASQAGTQFTPQQVQAQQLNPAQWAGQSLDPYMNPYIKNVIDAQAADQQEMYGQQYNLLASQAQAADAFGGSRFGVAQGQLSADAVRDQSLIAAQLRSQGFDTAAGLLSQDVDRQNWGAGLNQQMDFQSQLANQGADISAAGLRQDAARGMGFLAGAYQNSMANDASQLGAVGAAQQGLAQQQMDVNYGDYWDRTRAYPTQQMNWWSGAYGPAISARGLGTPATGGGAVGALGGAQIGSQIGSAVYDWWNRPPANNPAAMIDPSTGFTYEG